MTLYDGRSCSCELLAGAISGGIHGRTEAFLTNPPSIRSLTAHTHSPRFMLLEISLKIKSQLSRCIFCRIVHYLMKALGKALWVPVQAAEMTVVFCVCYGRAGIYVISWKSFSVIVLAVEKWQSGFKRLCGRIVVDSWIIIIYCVPSWGSWPLVWVWLSRF